MLVVSTDPDWRMYCAESPRPIWLGEFADASSGLPRSQEDINGINKNYP
ncbi:hypothetical protein B0G75_12612 [Paraburkholderia sp. BL18I3N2]|nr:hypothetical protein B0G75_12612 [Paraburkholderia sp. BL18I3N2]